MKKFLDEHFLLHSATAQRLYHDYAKELPILDYHCHLSPQQIADNITFGNITQAWLYGDHYKWRAMRTNGVNEDYITGSKTDFEKFEQWAATVPYTLRNPLYHWTHLELQRYFDVYDLLSPKTAKSIYDTCTRKLQQPEFAIHGLIKKMRVETICTTDDPLDNLEHHQKISGTASDFKVFPAFRPDKAMHAEDITSLNAYIDRLEAVTAISINNIDDYLKALKSRHDHFAANGCSVSDHGLEHIYAEDYTDEEITAIFVKIRQDKTLSSAEVLKFKSALLFHFALWDHEKGWVQQYHLGALRNNNTRLLGKLGSDTGFDSIGDFSQAAALSKFLNRLDAGDKLAKTIIYNLNPADNELIATMTGNFNDGSIAGKVQFGSAWWFLDQKEGDDEAAEFLIKHGTYQPLYRDVNRFSQLLSFPRHEYFRRLVCTLFAEDIENGELPADIDWAGKIIQDICYYNAKNYFNFNNE